MKINSFNLPRNAQIGHLSFNERYQTLSSFTSVYGIGPHTARHLYDVGLRTFDDLKRYLGSDENAEGSGGSFAWREGLRLREELAVKSVLLCLTFHVFC